MKRIYAALRDDKDDMDLGEDDEEMDSDEDEDDEIEEDFMDNGDAEDDSPPVFDHLNIDNPYNGYAVTGNFSQNIDESKNLIDSLNDRVTDRVSESGTFKRKTQEARPQENDVEGGGAVTSSSPLHTPGG